GLLITFGPGGHGVIRLVEEMVRVDRHDFAVLDLDHDLWNIDLATSLITDRRIGGFEIAFRDRIAHLLAVERASGFECIGEGLDIGYRRRDVIIRLVIEAMLEKLRELLPVAEPAVAHHRRDHPGRHTEDAFRILAKRDAEIM